MPYLNMPGLRDVEDVGPISAERILSAIEAADEAFWAVIAERFPEVESGDVAPDWVTYHNLRTRWEVSVWIAGNLPAPAAISDEEA